MKKVIAGLVIAGLAISTTPAFAIKQLNDVWKDVYAGEGANEELKTLVGEAKCNVCHIQGENKKKRNPYGEAVHTQIEDAKFPVKDFGKEPAKYTEQVKELFKKAGEMKPEKSDKTFAERIQANQLPGGDKEGKGL
jgi:hypothetical protein